MDLRPFSRTAMLIGDAASVHLSHCHVTVVGVGGVGSFVCEALARSGIGKMTLIDVDDISISNINRQIHATHQTLGQSKVLAMQVRIQAIHPDIAVDVKQLLLNADNVSEAIASDCDYVIDAIDMVSAKLALIHYCDRRDIAIISSMGTGNKLDPSQLRVSDIYQTHGDPLARVMRRELRKLKIKALKVVYSSEVPLKPFQRAIADANITTIVKRTTPGSSPFVPPAAGIMIAAEVVKDLISRQPSA